MYEVEKDDQCGDKSVVMQLPIVFFPILRAPLTCAPTLFLQNNVPNRHRCESTHYRKARIHEQLFVDYPRFVLIWLKYPVIFVVQNFVEVSVINEAVERYQGLLQFCYGCNILEKGRDIWRPLHLKRGNDHDHLHVVHQYLDKNRMNYIFATLQGTCDECRNEKEKA